MNAGMFGGIVLGISVIAAAVTTAFIYGIPWLWALIKPWLHSITG